jgi:16S rRNA (guanine1207-N2)-methyltransferase
MFYANAVGIELRFETTPSLFSPSRLDRGSLALLSRIRFEPSDKVLDLGCGYGLFGICAAKVIGADRVWMVDNDPIAVDCALRNLALNRVEGASVAISDGFRNLRETGFNKIVCNPPYHADFAVPKHFIEKGFNRLVLNGAIYIVTKRRTWYENKLRTIFGGVRTSEVDSYFVFEAIKRSFSYATKSRTEPGSRIGTR